jgi:hypothetical protein
MFMRENRRWAFILDLLTTTFADPAQLIVYSFGKESKPRGGRPLMAALAGVGNLFTLHEVVRPYALNHLHEDEAIISGLIFSGLSAIIDIAPLGPLCPGCPPQPDRGVFL